MSAAPPSMCVARYRLAPEHPLHERGSVVTIGSYDGLHLGHQALLRRVCTVAGERGLVSVVMSFEPTPKEFFAPDDAPARLMRFREKFEALRRLGIDVFFCPRFDAGMAAVSPEDFAGQLLAGRLRARHVIVGDDFRYARGRSGDTATLRDAGARLGFSVERLDTVSVGQTRVSSTTIRAALEAGELTRAARYQGRPYRMSGRV
ncbi:MAG: adenylyltransferase/cytidyltransferase family protein, partial [Pseudomonadota bacterium]